MISYWQALRSILLPALLGLVVGCLLIGLGMGIFRVPPTSFSNFVAAWALGFFYALWAMVLGALPTFSYGAPLYALARLKSRASYGSALAIGSLPGLVLFLTTHDYVILAHGAAVGLCTHFFARRRPLDGLDANNSFKPNPLRESA